MSNMGNSTKRRRWYVAATHPNRENLAKQQLESQDLEIYFPKRLKTIRHARRTMNRVVSFFPGYVFVALDLHADKWRAVNGTFGVRSLIMGGDMPVPTPEGVVEQLQEMTDKQGFLRRHEELRPGDDVRILNGPMAEMIGTLERLDGKHRVRVLLRMLHGEMSLIVPTENLSKIAHASALDEPRYSKIG